MNQYTITVIGTNIRILVAYLDGKLVSIDNVNTLDAQAWDLIKSWISSDEEVTKKRFDVIMAIPGNRCELMPLLQLKSNLKSNFKPRTS